ncbi:N-acetylglucosamine kinase [soil metagenome]
MSVDGKKLVIGVDGGGTKTSGALYLDGKGIIAEGNFPSSNPHSNSEDHVRDALGTMVKTLVEQGKVQVDQIDGVCMGMAGADRPADKGFLERIIREFIQPQTKLIIVNDAVVAMVAVLKKLHGILLISGTGSICYGYNAHTDTSTRCGGWGHLLADEGSGYKIGLAALQAIMHSYDEREAKTSLTDRILGDLQLKSPTDLVGWIYMGKNGKTEIAALSRIVHEEDEKGDEVSHKILNEQADTLVEIVVPVYRRLFGVTNEEAQLALWGGNLLNARRYQQTFLSKLEKTGLNLKPVMKDGRAVMGAIHHMLNHL